MKKRKSFFFFYIIRKGVKVKGWENGIMSQIESGLKKWSGRVFKIKIKVKMKIKMKIKINGKRKRMLLKNNRIKVFSKVDLQNALAQELLNVLSVKNYSAGRTSSEIILKIDILVYKKIT